MMSSSTHVVTCVSVLLLFAIQLSASMHLCNLAKQYIVHDNSGKPVSCLKCPSCKTGSEPGIPCGSKIGINEKSGLCTSCKPGTYSDSEDVHPCKSCNSEMCFKHQIIGGICTIKRDTSHCLDKCEKGYVMSNDKTVCDVAKPHVIITTAARDLSTKHTSYSYVTAGSEVEKETKLDPVAIIFIVLFAIAVIAIAFGIFVYWRYTKSQETTPVKDEVKEETNSTELLSADSNSSINEDVNNEDNIHQQAHSMMPSSSDDRLLPQNPAFLDPSNTNQVLVSTFTPGNHIINEIPVQSRASCKEAVAPSMTCLSNFNDKDPSRIKYGIPGTLYLEICVTFDTGPDGKNWKALAGWLEFNVQEIRCFGLKEKNQRTDTIIQKWEIELGNDIDKFVQILIANEMTYLAQKIRNLPADQVTRVT